MENKKPIKIYEYITDRAKFGIKGKTAPSLKRELYNKKGGLCYICKGIFRKGQLELEHKVPVVVGGHLFDESNIDLCCLRCHRDKTTKDMKAIRIMKQMKIISGKWNIHSYYPLEEVLFLFKSFSDIFEFLDERKAIYEIGENGKDYVQIMQKQNREELK